MHTFYEYFSRYNWQQEQESIYAKEKADVESALYKPHRNLEDFKALISPAAQSYLEEMAQLSNALTLKRFGKAIQLYMPMYLSNECQNICTYCGFSFTNKIPRRTLTDKEILREAEYIKSKGHQHILLVTGEANKTVGTDYIENAVRLIKPLFSHISIEVQPLNKEDYVRLIKAGVNTVLVYQETYNEQAYKIYHPKGKKSNFKYRIETPDRLGKAGIHKIGLGVLLGLEDWRTDSFFTALHLTYLRKKYWQTKYSISFPRLRPYTGEQVPKKEISDKELVQLICAYRLLDEDLELSVSTRESAVFRDNIILLGATTLSTESRTNPGGYVVAPQSLEQFEIHDNRTTEEIKQIIRSKGYEPVMKDWDYALRS
ncbi:MAG: 2-iminoacetate synthase ThiH [Bacteroidetes bacterium]|nr:MAG: 2-iminoacetate synthase ThiH [Bacteroidota bacterium]